MSKPVIAVLALAAVAAGGYTVLWNKEAAHLKDVAASMVAQTNEAAKPLMKTGELIHVDGYETSGFPFAITVNAKNPTISIPVDALFRIKDQDEGKTTVPADFSWIEEINYAQGISFSADAMGSKFTLAFNGDHTQKSIVNGKVRNAFVMSSDSPMLLKLETSSLGLFSLPQFKDAETFAKVFHTASISSNHVTIKDLNNNAVIGTSGIANFSIHNKVDAGTRSASIKFEANGSKYTKDADPLFTSYLALIGEVIGKTPQKLPYSISELNDSSYNIDIAYVGPDNFSGFTDSKVKARFDVNAFDVKSPLINTETMLHASTEALNNERKILLNMHIGANVSERYEQVLRDQFKTALEELANTQGKSGKELEVAQSMAKLGSPSEIVNTLLPKFHALGDMSYDMDINAQGPLDPKAFVSQAHYEVNAFNILSTPYGIKLKLQVDGMKPNKTPTGNLTLACLNCDAMIDDASNYVNRFLNYMDAMTPEKKTVHASQAFYDGVKAFLHSIALNGKDPAAKDLNITAEMKNTGDISVSGKPIMEVMQSYMTNIAPNLPAQPANETVPSPSTVPPLSMPTAP